jgi:hypothetical protein
MARRAGLEQFLKDDNQPLSEDIWKETIEPALRSSHACTVIWTNNTVWAKGVEREIQICHEARILEPEFIILVSQTQANQHRFNLSFSN